LSSALHASASQTPLCAPTPSSTCTCKTHLMLRDKHCTCGSLIVYHCHEHVATLPCTPHGHIHACAPYPHKSSTLSCPRLHSALTREGVSPWNYYCYGRTLHILLSPSLLFSVNYFRVTPSIYLIWFIPNKSVSNVVCANTWHVSGEKLFWSQMGSPSEVPDGLCLQS
jgi:hypothetical protein